MAKYATKEIQIFEMTAKWKLLQSDDNLIVIVTCFPFLHSDRALGKIQVVCILYKQRNSIIMLQNVSNHMINNGMHIYK